MPTANPSRLRLAFKKRLMYSRRLPRPTCLCMPITDQRSNEEVSCFLSAYLLGLFIGLADEGTITPRGFNHSINALPRLSNLEKRQLASYITRLSRWNGENSRVIDDVLPLSLLDKFIDEVQAILPAIRMHRLIAAVKSCPPSPSGGLKKRV